MKKEFALEDIRYEFLSSRRPLDSFKCADTEESMEIEQFLREEALFFHQQGLAKTVLALWEETVVGYFSLAMGKIHLTWGKKEKAFGKKIAMEIPALLLARMGVHEHFRGQRIGTAMMLQALNIADEVSKKVACRFIYVDAKLQSVDFYKKLDFEENKCEKHKNDEGLINMILDLETIKTES
jgi:GNAT superfamily N-acetyltransferase